MPPPSPASVWLFATAQFINVKSPAFSMAAPLAPFVAKPDAMLIPLKTLVVPLPVMKTRTASFPLTVSKFVPGPFNTMLSVIRGRGEERTIVPVVVISTVSSPGMALASRIACLSDPGPESEFVETVSVAE